jgi:hypothetical protein
VDNIHKVDKEKVEEESKLASVEVQIVDDEEDVEEEPAKVPPLNKRGLRRQLQLKRV